MIIVFGNQKEVVEKPRIASSLQITSPTKAKTVSFSMSTFRSLLLTEGIRILKISTTNHCMK